MRRIVSREFMLLTASHLLHPVAQRFLDLHALFQSIPVRALRHGVACVHRDGDAPRIDALTGEGLATFWTPAQTAHAALHHAQLRLRLDQAFAAFLDAVAATPALARMRHAVTVRFLRGGTGKRGVARADLAWGDLRGNTEHTPGGATFLKASYGHFLPATELALVLDAAARTEGDVALHAFFSLGSTQPHAAWAVPDTLRALLPSLCEAGDRPSLWAHVDRFPAFPSLPTQVVPEAVNKAHDALVEVARVRANTTGANTPGLLLQTGPVRRVAMEDAPDWARELEHLWDTFWDEAERWIPSVAHRTTPGVHSLYLPAGTNSVTGIAFFGAGTSKNNPTYALKAGLSTMAGVSQDRLWGVSSWGASGPWLAPGGTAEEAARTGSHIHRRHREGLMLRGGVLPKTSGNTSALITALDMIHVDVWTPVG